MKIAFLKTSAGLVLLLLASGCAIFGEKPFVFMGFDETKTGQLEMPDGTPLLVDKVSEELYGYYEILRDRKELVGTPVIRDGFIYYAYYKSGKAQFKIGTKQNIMILKRCRAKISNMDSVFAP